MFRESFKRQAQMRQNKKMQNKKREKLMEMLGEGMEDTDKKLELNDSKIIFSAEKIGIPIETL